MYSNMKYNENLRVIKQDKNRKLKKDNCWQRTSLSKISIFMIEQIYKSHEKLFVHCVQMLPGRVYFFRYCTSIFTFSYTTDIQCFPLFWLQGKTKQNICCLNKQASNSFFLHICIIETCIINKTKLLPLKNENNEGN